LAGARTCSGRGEGTTRRQPLGKAGKMALGGLVLALGLMIASGLDKWIETFLVDLSPAWLT
jgi:hypothetical protein